MVVLGSGGGGGSGLGVGVVVVVVVAWVMDDCWSCLVSSCLFLCYGWVNSWLAGLGWAGLGGTASTTATNNNNLHALHALQPWERDGMGCSGLPID